MLDKDLQPTKENIIATFLKDALDRNNELYNYVNILNEVDKCYSIAIDSYWGTGKTFFVKQLKMIYDINNDFAYEHFENDEVKKAWSKLCNNDDSCAKNYTSIYYDAWMNDNDNDPILSLVYQILITTGTENTLKDKVDIKNICKIAGDIFKRQIGFDPNRIINELKGDDPLAIIQKGKSLQEQINDLIDSIIPEHGQRLLIIVDELDRCNPEFAVRFLERIKHYFTNDKVTFLFSINRVELLHTIKRFYGVEFSADRYLDRFFDLTLPLAKPNLSKYLEMFHNVPNNSFIINTNIRLIVEKFELGARETSRYVQLSKMLIKDQTMEGTQRKALILINNVVLPVMIALYLTNHKKYNDFINGHDNTPFIDFYTSDDSIDNSNYYLVKLYNLDESKNLKNDKELLTQKLDQFCKSITSQSNIKEIGEIYISKQDKDYFRKAMSLITERTIKKQIVQQYNYLYL